MHTSTLDRQHTVKSKLDNTLRLIIVERISQPRDLAKGVARRSLAKGHDEALSGYMPELQQHRPKGVRSWQKVIPDVLVLKSRNALFLIRCSLQLH